MCAHPHTATREPPARFRTRPDFTKPARRFVTPERSWVKSGPNLGKPGKGGVGWRCFLPVVVILVIAGIYFGSRGGGRRDGNDAAGGYYGPYGAGRDHGHDGH